jgi:hypothetical protein
MRPLPGLLVSMVLAMSACGGGPPPVASLTGDRESALLLRRELSLGWRAGEEGEGDRAGTEILLEGLRVGQGEGGLSDLRRIVRSLSKGTRLVVQAPPLDETAVPCPFDRGLRDYCDRFGVTLVLPDSR